eukprot:gene13192-biopygen1977
MPACPRIQAPGSLGRAGPKVDHRNPLHKGDFKLLGLQEVRTHVTTFLAALEALRTGAVSRRRRFLDLSDTTDIFGEPVVEPLPKHRRRRAAGTAGCRLKFVGSVCAGPHL